MKTLLSVALVLCVAAAAWGQAQPITKEDLRDMETRMKEYIDVRVSELRSDLKSDIKSLNAKVDELDKRLSSQIDSVKWLLGIAVLFILAVLAMPQAMGYARERREAKQMAEIISRIERIEKRLEIV
jgi:hypothetical protein